MQKSSMRRGRIVGGGCRDVSAHQRQYRSRSLADAAVGLATATIDAITEVYKRGRATPAITRDEFTEPAPQLAHDPRPMLSAIYPRGSVCAVVLGGGEADSRRLFPLTEKRTLPAIPLAGTYRLIDVPLSNLVNSGIHKVFVLTQYNSTSLNKYIQRTYDWHGTVPLGGDGGAFMEVVAATQNPREQRWADGAADTVRQWWNMFHGNPLERFIEDILILPSDHVYRMDFEDLVEFHRHSLADLTLVCRPVEERLVDHFGIVKLGAHSTSIQTFEEKPQSEERKALMSMDFDDVQEFANDQYAHSIPFLGAQDDVNTIDHKSPQGKSWIASCGIMLFRKEALDALLKGNKRDFGRELIPDAISKGMKVVAFNHPGYWADIGGSIADYHDFNISLAKGQIPFAFDGTAAHDPFICSWANLPPNSIQGCHLKDVLLSSGCRIEGSTVRGSVIGNRTIIGNGCLIEDSNIMGADYYEWEKDFKRQVGPQFPPIGIGENCIIKKTIVDKNARIGNNVQLLNTEGVFESMDRLSKGVAIRDNVIIVTKSAVLPDGLRV